jgi:integrase
LVLHQSEESVVSINTEKAGRLVRKRAGASVPADRATVPPVGAARLESLAIHHSRHTFISHAQAIAEVRDAAGHANVSITSGYLHVALDDEAAVGNLFVIR